MKILATVDQVKTLGLTQQNADAKTIALCISRSQDIYIQTALGTPLYKYVLSLETYNEDYTELVDEYILPCLVAYTDYRCAIFLSEKITNKGAGRVTDTNFQVQTQAESNELLERLKDDADFYKRRLIGYLQDDDGAKFPLYLEHECKKENVKKEGQSFGINWYS
jgi:hypothetical protein